MITVVFKSNAQFIHIYPKHKNHRWVFFCTVHLRINVRTDVLPLRSHVKRKIGSYDDRDSLYRDRRRRRRRSRRLRDECATSSDSHRYRPLVVIVSSSYVGAIGIVRVRQIFHTRVLQCVRTDDNIVYTRAVVFHPFTIIIIIQYSDQPPSPPRDNNWSRANNIRET